MRGKFIIVLGIIATLSLIFIVAINSGYITNIGVENYLFQNGSLPLSGNWDTGSQIITIGSGASDWFDPNWNYRKSVIVDSGDIDEVLTDFPVLVYLNSDRINWSYVQDDLDDLRFISNDNETVLDYEIESSIVNVDARIWLNLPSASNISDTWFWMYWGNDATASGENIEDVWDNNFVMVQHMVDNNTSSILDSTQYDNDGSKFGVNEPIETDMGIINSAQDFDGSDDNIEIQSQTALDITDNFTFESWINHDVPSSTQISLFSSLKFKQGGIEIFKDNRDTPRIQIHYVADRKDAYTSGGNLIPSGTWYYVVISYDKDLVSSNIKFYIDGSSVATGQGDFTTSVGTNINTPVIGDSYLGTPNWSDLMDEMRFSNSTRSPSWIKASYETGIDDLLTFGSEVSIGGRIIFRDGDLYITSSKDGHLELGADESIDLNAPVSIDGNLNMSHNYVLYFEQQYWLTLEMEQGVTDHTVNAIPFGVLSQDQRFTILMVAVDPAPTEGKIVNVTISNGVSSMEVTLTGNTLFNHTMLGAFDLDVSAQNFELIYSQTGGGATEHACIMIHWYYKENE